MAFSLPLPSWLLTLSITDDGGGDGGSGLRKIVRFSSRNEKTMNFAKNSLKNVRTKGNEKGHRLLLLVSCWLLVYLYLLY